MKAIAHFLFLMSHFILLASVAKAQVPTPPYINSISQPLGAIKDSIHISGSHFGPTAQTQVYFGGAKSPNVKVSGGNLITAEVPPGATYDAVSVVNTTTHLTAYSSGRFHLTFAGEHVSGASLNFKPQKTWATDKKQAQDLSVCDFDGDGDMDVVVSNVGGSDPTTKNPGVTLFTNVSTGFQVNQVNFNHSSIGDNYSPEHLTTGDLNGDGRPDLIVTELGGQGRVFIYRNTTTTANKITFTSPTLTSNSPTHTLSLPRDGSGNFRHLGHLAIRDLDLDGKPEVVVASKDENTVFFFKNESAGGDISFSNTPQSIEATKSAGSSGFGGLEVVDLNADGWVDMVASNATDHGIYVFQNRSRTGHISFLPALFFDTPANIRTLKVVDLNQDALPDIIVNSNEISSNNTLEIFENTTAKRKPGAKIDFKPPVIINASDFERSWGMSVGDIDGDGDLDLAIASYGEGFYLVMNTNPKGAAINPSSFEVKHIKVKENSRNIKIVDIDKDGKPDVVYTNKSASDQLGNLAVSLNNNCLHPKILSPSIAYTKTSPPNGKVVLCQGDDMDLVASGSGYTYQWKRGATDVGRVNAQTLEKQNMVGDYTVSVNDRCAHSSPIVRLEQSDQKIAKPVFTASDDTPCEDSNVTFTISSDTKDIASYHWEGPNGFTNTNQNPTLSKATSLASGWYRVTATSTGDGCKKTSDAVILRVITLPIVSVKAVSNQFCSSRQLTANRFTGYTYQWKKGTVNVADQTSPDGYTTSEAGDYAIAVKGSGCSHTSTPIILTKIAPPTVAFSGPNPITLCQNVSNNYKAASATSVVGVTIENQWNFGDDTTIQTGNEVSHTYRTAGNYKVSLTAGYLGVQGCESKPAAKDITIVTAPKDKNVIIAQSSTPTIYEKCRKVSLVLTLKDPSKYDSTKWFVTNHASHIVSTEPTFSVLNASEISARLVTKVGKCPLTATPVKVLNYKDGGIAISAVGSNAITDEPETGKVIRLNEGQTSIRLSVDATQPLWKPESMIDDSKATEVLVTPQLARQLVTVHGKDRLGCDEDAKITLLKPGVQAEKSFTPNGDGTNDCWKVSNIRSTDCTIVVFDHKEREIRRFSFSPDNTTSDDCVWDGNISSGSPVAEGIYYYMINCSDKAKASSGPILLAR